MRKLLCAPLVVIGMLPLLFAAATDAAEHRAIACKTPAIAASCRWMRGRFAFYNGTPAYRFWPVGTHHLYGIYSGPGRLPDLDNESPNLPRNLTEAISDHPFAASVFGEFEVCPLEPEYPRTMQAACIASAKHLVNQK